MSEEKDFQLYDFIQVTCEIKCDFCGTVDDLMVDDTAEATEIFYRDGWRGRRKCYCPKCVKKKLKNKN